MPRFSGILPRHLGILHGILGICPDFQVFCPDFQQIETFGGALSPSAPPLPTLLLGPSNPKSTTADRCDILFQTNYFRLTLRARGSCRPVRNPETEYEQVDCSVFAPLFRGTPKRMCVPPSYDVSCHSYIRQILIKVPSSRID